MRKIDYAGSMFICAVLIRMKELGLNNTSLAARMKISRPYVVKVLRGDVNITLGAATRFAKTLGMDFIPVLAEHRGKKYEENSMKLIVGVQQ